ncbi:hypothetical protein [Nocardia tengchongensis]|uniref:hypothetical protein n=1 Tax=Nocardia tengchongensis TaxID=2055889 RepID=UPI00361D20EF
MPEPIDPTDPFADIAAKLQTEQEAEAARFAEMFTVPAICNICGAHVAIPKAHKEFHDLVAHVTIQLAADIQSVGRAAGVIPDA